MSEIGRKGVEHSRTAGRWKRTMRAAPKKANRDAACGVELRNNMLRQVGRVAKTADLFDRFAD